MVGRRSSKCPWLVSFQLSIPELIQVCKSIFSGKPRLLCPTPPYPVFFSITWPVLRQRHMKPCCRLRKNVGGPWERHGEPRLWVGHTRWKPPVCAFPTEFQYQPMAIDGSSHSLKSNGFSTCGTSPSLGELRRYRRSFTQQAWAQASPTRPPCCGIHADPSFQIASCLDFDPLTEPSIPSHLDASPRIKVAMPV
jgi:hypothetical protein